MYLIAIEAEYKNRPQDMLKILLAGRNQIQSTGGISHRGFWWKMEKKYLGHGVPPAFEEVRCDADTEISKASFQVNGFGGAKLVRAKEMYQS